jgi:hypothetical protein
MDGQIQIVLYSFKTLRAFAAIRLTLEPEVKINEEGDVESWKQSTSVGHIKAATILVRSTTIP